MRSRSPVRRDSYERNLHHTSQPVSVAPLLSCPETLSEHKGLTLELLSRELVARDLAKSQFRAGAEPRGTQAQVRASDVKKPECNEAEKVAGLPSSGWFKEKVTGQPPLLGPPISTHTHLNSCRSCLVRSSSSSLILASCITSDPENKEKRVVFMESQNRAPTK